MAYTRAELRAKVRLVLTGATDWPDATLNSWIDDAIQFYSATFPRRNRYTLTCVTGTQAYALPGLHGIHRILSVEYPTGEDPQTYLREVNEWDADFQNAEEVYALRGIGDATTHTADTAAATIVFAETVTTGQYAVIEYTGLHPVPSADTSQITVPPQHWLALTTYCEFRAYCELLGDEAITVGSSNVSIVLSQLTDTSRAAWTRFKDVMNKLAYEERGHSAILTWNSARIY